MCVQDIQIARQCRAVGRTATPVGNRVAVQANGNRVGLLFSFTGNQGQYQLAYNWNGTEIPFLSGDSYFDTNLLAPVYSGSFNVNVRDHPGIVTGEMVFITPDNNAISYVELLVDSITSRLAEESYG